MIHEISLLLSKTRFTSNQLDPFDLQISILELNLADREDTKSALTTLRNMTDCSYAG